ncbi:MAG: spore photoproduct lyase family protein [Candidatus Omnitrophota bacterium]
MEELCKNLNHDPLPNRLKKLIGDTFSLGLSQNQLRDLTRLIFEIVRRKKISPQEIIADLKKNVPSPKYPGKNKFRALKNILINYRFPETAKYGRIDSKKIFLSQLRKPLANNWQVAEQFKPLKIIVERAAKQSRLLANFQRKFPDAEVEEIDYYSRYLTGNKFRVSQLKKPLVFIIKERGDFIKRCPCTKGHLNCGYWIFNLGFGCPFDCSYCFLQQYSNFPGIILPANIEDFLVSFDKFYRNLKKPTRIGTGEFSDSLALDDITEYSQLLIPYFAQKNLLFELKTKSNKITNLLKLKISSPRIIISWSLSPQAIIAGEEKGTASLDLRLEAAKKIQQAGFRVGFHFDPIIHLEGWEKLYEELINKLYAYLLGPFAWISLGTLRCRRQLKTIAELRFPQSNIFYGELFLGKDKKLRYPGFIRDEIYRKIIKGIRNFDQKTPIYLCMEDKPTWANQKGLVPTSDVAGSLIA